MSQLFTGLIPAAQTAPQTPSYRRSSLKAPSCSSFRPPGHRVHVLLHLRHHEGSQLRPLPEVAVRSAENFPHASAVFRPTSSWVLPEADGEKIGARSRRPLRSTSGGLLVALHRSLPRVSQY